jgi:O-antigen/teichoic acid export membrane protein
MLYLNRNINLNNIALSTLPGLLSILLTFFSIPIYLKFLQPNVYSSFLISHVFMALSLVFNFNIGKIASIKIQNKKLITKNIIISNALFLSVIISLIFSFLVILVLKLIFIEEEKINFFLVFIGIFISIFYINIEAIAKGLGKFKTVAFSNLIFYGFSISAPSFIFFFLNNKTFLKNFDLLYISIIFKFISIFFIIFFLKHHIFRNFILDQKIMLKFRNQSLWMTLTNFYNQIFDYLDKYLIKLFFNPMIFINYLISQQIASKLSIFSSSIIAVLLPKLASQQKKIYKVKVLSLHLFFFYIPVSILIVLFHFIFDDLLQWWLKDSFNYNIYNIFILFLIVTFISCMSNILISHYEAIEITKLNTIFESIMIIPFIFCLFISVQSNNIILVCYLILIKELLLFFTRAFYIKEYLVFFKDYIFSFFLFLIFWITHDNDNLYIFYGAKILFYLSVVRLFFLLIKKFKKIL